MQRFWKWIGVAACGFGLAVAVNRLNVVTAAEDGPARQRSGDSGDRLDRIADKLERLLDHLEGRMGPGGPPRRERHDPPHDGPHPEGRLQGPGHERSEWSGPPRMPHDVPPEMRGMLERRMNEGRERLQQAREEMQERMDMAREKMEQLAARVKALEAEVGRLKAAKEPPQTRP